MERQRGNCIFAAMQKELKKCDIVLADDTGAISATIWESLIPLVEDQQSYLFSSLKVGYFRRRCLNATVDSKIAKCEADVSLSTESITAAEQLKPVERKTQDVSGRIAAVDISKCHVCLSCKSRITPEEKGSEFVQCSSCNLKVLKENLACSVSASLLIVNESGENLGRFHCQDDVLNSMLQSVSETENYNISEINVANLTSNFISETLLLIKNVSFRILAVDKLVIDMKVTQ